MLLFSKRRGARVRSKAAARSIALLRLAVAVVRPGSSLGPVPELTSKEELWLEVVCLSFERDESSMSITTSTIDSVGGGAGLERRGANIAAKPGRRSCSVEILVVVVAIAAVVVFKCEAFVADEIAASALREALNSAIEGVSGLNGDNVNGGIDVEMDKGEGSRGDDDSESVDENENDVDGQEVGIVGSYWGEMAGVTEEEEEADDDAPSESYSVGVSACCTELRPTEDGEGMLLPLLSALLLDSSLLKIRTVSGPSLRARLLRSLRWPPA